MKDIIVTVCQTVVVCVVVFIVWQVILFAANLVYKHVILKRVDKKEAEHQANVEVTCQDVLARTDRAETILKECRNSAHNFPEEHRNRLFAECDALDESLRRIRSNVARIRKSVGIEVNYEQEI